uniref:Uncharacterized protein n=1 Tax=Macaca fascicularis TaxID=9541 RepID=A0A2K5WT24_MACFA
MKLERNLKRNFSLRRQQARCPRARSLSTPGAWCGASTMMTSVKASCCSRSCCPKGARRNSGITSSTWPWGTTGSRWTRGHGHCGRHGPRCGGTGRTHRTCCVQVQILKEAWEPVENAPGGPVHPRCPFPVLPLHPVSVLCGLQLTSAPLRPVLQP